MGFSWDTEGLEASSRLQDLHISSAEDALTRFINNGIRRTELRTDGGTYDGSEKNLYEKQGWLKSEQIYKPEFYGSPSPRMDAVSGHCHFRETNNDFSKSALFQADVSGSDYQAIPGLCTRIKLHHKAAVYVHTSFYAYEIGGLADTYSLSHFARGITDRLPYAGYHGSTAADFRLMINGSTMPSTKRKVFVSTLEPFPAAFGDSRIDPLDTETTSNYGSIAEHISFSEPSGPTDKDNQMNDGQLFFNMLSRHQHFLTYATKLEPGIHDIGMACKPASQSSTFTLQLRQYDNQSDSVQMMKFYGVEAGEMPEFKRKKHIFVVARNLVVDSYYYETDS
tara:strand:+ start:1788 stop:2798 length:1011 start_codon:yes stop_codon:yes gene_type:complete